MLEINGPQSLKIYQDNILIYFLASHKLILVTSSVDFAHLFGYQWLYFINIRRLIYHVL